MYSENDNLKLFPTERKRSYPKCIVLVFFLISKQPKITRIRGSSILSRMNHQTPTWVRGEEYFIWNTHPWIGYALNDSCKKQNFSMLDRLHIKCQSIYDVGRNFLFNTYISTCTCDWKEGWTLLCHPTSKIILTEWD